MIAVFIREINSKTGQNTTKAKRAKRAKNLDLKLGAGCILSVTYDYGKEWEEAHPGEKYTMNWNFSLDYIAGDSDEPDVDKSNVLAGASYDPFDEEEVSPEVRRLRDVYQLVLLEERGYTEVAKILDCSPANVKQICNKVIALIKAGV